MTLPTTAVSTKKITPMKVVKLAAGYTIRCTDSQFAALRLMTKIGPAALQPQHQKDLFGQAKSVLASTQFTQESGPLTVTDDRRR